MIILWRYYWQRLQQRWQARWDNLRCHTGMRRVWLGMSVVVGILITCVAWLPVLALQLSTQEMVSLEQISSLYIQLVVVLALTLGAMYATYLAARDLYGLNVPMVVRNAPGGGYYWWLQMSRVIIQAMVPTALGLLPVLMLLVVAFQAPLVVLLGVSGILSLAAAAAAASGILVVAVGRFLSRLVTPSVRSRYQRLIVLLSAGLLLVVSIIPFGYGLLTGQALIPLTWLMVAEVGVGLTLYGLGVVGVVLWLWWRDANRLSDVTSFVQARVHASEWAGTFLSWTWPTRPRLILLQAELVWALRDARYWLRSALVISVWVLWGAVGYFAVVTSELPHQQWWYTMLLLGVSAWAVTALTRQFILYRKSNQWWRTVIFATPVSPLWWREVKVLMTMVGNCVAVVLVLLVWWSLGMWSEEEWFFAVLLYIQTGAVSFGVAFWLTKDYQPYSLPVSIEPSVYR